MSTELLPIVSHIVSLESQNVKRLKAVRIEPKGNALVIIGGANEAGKSSVLDSIAMVLGGRAEMPEVPVRKGQKRAQIICDLGSIIVKRTLTKEGGGTLTIEGADGHKFTSPQTLLEQLTGKIAFDPISFMRLKPDAQKEALRQLLKFDFSEIDKQHAALYEERTAVNRDVTRLTGSHASLPRFEDVPTAEVSSAGVLNEIEEAQAWNNAIDAAELDATTKKTVAANTDSHRVASVARYQSALADIDTADRYRATVATNHVAAMALIPKLPRIDVEPLEKELARIMADIKSAHAHNKAVYDAEAKVREVDQAAKAATGQIARAREAADAAKVDVDANTKAAETAASEASTARALADSKPRRNLDALRAKLASVEDTNRKVRANTQKSEALKSLREKESKSTTLSQAMEDLVAKKQELLAAAKYPVAGLGFNEDGVAFNDLPLSQASSAQQLRISVAIAAAMNPKLRVMLVRDGSLLDDANLALLKELCVSFDLQCWVERVGHGAECSVIIADGEVEGVESTSTEEAKT